MKFHLFLRPPVFAFAIAAIAPGAFAQTGAQNGPPRERVGPNEPAGPFGPDNREGPGGPGGFFPGGRGPGGPMQPELKVRAQFDKDGNKILDAAERKAARDYLANNSAGRRGPGGRMGGPGGRGGRGGFGGGNEPGTPGEPISPADVKAFGAEPLYSPDTLRTLFFTFEDKDWEKEMEEFHKTDIDLPATLLVDGKTYRDVGVHFRGASSYFAVAAGSKRSLAVSLDMAHEKQNLLGFRSLNLLNSHEDESFLRPVLFSRIAQNYLPTPRVNFVRVVINGENWGVYSSAEQFNKDFTVDRFDSSKGARWKVPGSPGGRGSLAYLGDSPDAYRRIYEIKSKDDPKSWARLVRMTKALNETPPDQLEATLGPLLDIDGALKFLAMEMVFVNGDGYWTRTSDYSIAEDGKGQLHVIPHDMNETFSLGRGGPGGRGGFGRGPGGRGVGREGGGPPGEFQRGPGGPGGGRGGFGGPGGRGGPGGGGVELDPLIGANNENTPLISKLLAAPALRTRYLSYVREIAETWLDWSKLGPLAHEYHDLIDADVKRDTRKLSSYEEFTASVEGPRSLKTFADQRRSYLLNHPAIKALPAAVARTP